MSQTIVNPHGIHINMDEFTSNVATDQTDWTVTGNGIFDLLMETGTAHLVAQTEPGRIRGEDYAQLYMQMYQINMQAALQIWLQKPLMEAQKESEEAKRELYRRQIKGFDEDFKQKILKICADFWGVCFSVSKDSFKADAGGSFPAIGQTGTINEFFNKLVYTEMENYEWKEDKYPDSDNRTKLTTEKIKVVNVEDYA